MKKIKFLTLAMAFIMLLSVSAFAYEEYDFSFDDYDEENTYDDLADGERDLFELVRGTPASNLDIRETDGRMYAYMHTYSDLHTYDAIEDEYVFSVDINADPEKMHTVCVRGVVGDTIFKTNPANQGVEEGFAFYEWDWYTNNGGSDENAESFLGGAGGLHVSLNPEGFAIRIKAYTEEALNIATYKTVVPYEIDASKFYNLKFYDDGQTVTILVDGAVIATVELTDAGKTYNDNDGTLESDTEYFGKAVVKDASGAELLTVENTRITSASSIIALATRNPEHYLKIDNIHLVIGEGAISDDKGSNPSTNPGDETGTSTNTPSDTSSPDNITDNTADAATNATTDGETKADDNKKDGGNSTLIIVIVIVAVVAVVGVVAVVVTKKKK